MTRAAQLAGLGSLEGNAPAYACRAWVNFNGTGTVAIRASGNVSSITDNGVGNWTCNFANSMPDGNYSVSVEIGGSGAGDSGVSSLSGSPSLSTASCKVMCIYPGVNNYDASYVCVSVFR